MKNQKMKKGIKSKTAGIFFVAMLLIVSVVGCGSSKDTITIGGKNFTEQNILVYMMADLIKDKTNLNVVTKPNLGGTLIVSQALDRGDLDLYAEYTGTALTVQLKEAPMTDPDAVYQKVKEQYEAQKKLTWLKPLGFNNTYTLTMSKAEAEKYGIKTFSDLTKVAPNMTLVCEQEFLERSDGYKGLETTYGLHFKTTKGMDAGLTYDAVKSGKADVNDAFATDGRIAAFNLVSLTDDKHFFPPYYAAPVIRDATLTKHPEIADTLNLLAGKLSDETMQQLNAKVDVDKQDPKDVASDWLKSQGLIK
ncbi:glycine betaine ABC transporter substrate-binding protein [Desulfosporosinus sp. PR]|uniref:glycine betaine ABC transporter substrate-binding protein n=1 Tax=Candidatus Desulfosporosinus nitrosoreducens TaxID=3401928 RepID=UPI0027F121FC|nr:glycine betaine ABC transporter substrate-binding protein [Desulfosporosinus sp. PR]MDQ7096402.1 glycine betaine ABC transporter substrate-binding protein [Desulfosporosinus sp. PR]